MDYFIYSYVAHIEQISNVLAGVKGFTLDAGCGVEAKFPSFHTSVGIDLSKKNLIKAKLRRPNTSFIMADLSYLPTKDKKIRSRCLRGCIGAYSR